MESFQELYRRLLKSELSGNLKEELSTSAKDFDPHQLDCLLRPKEHGVVLKMGKCDCDENLRENCVKSCLFDALYKDSDRNVKIREDLCVGCSDCIKHCQSGKLTASRELLPLLYDIKQGNAPVYAMIAPAFISQFPGGVTPGKLRSAFKNIGFSGMLEVALFADILTLKESFEFDKNINSEKDFLLTSCCCPLWIAMIRKVYEKLVPHIPGAVSPMVACGRSIKRLYPDAITVFIGPCLAKKAEAREADIKDAVDYVLTFEETLTLFELLSIDPSSFPEDARDHSSRAGRIYAKSGGVSEAVKSSVKRISPDRAIEVKPRHADGVPACREMLNELISGNIKENFLEGMGCRGGCVGGPKAILDREEGKANVERYASDATYETPIDNPYVIELLRILGFDTPKDLLEKDNIFIRKF